MIRLKGDKIAYIKPPNQDPRVDQVAYIDRRFSLQTLRIYFILLLKKSLDLFPRVTNIQCIILDFGHWKGESRRFGHNPSGPYHVLIVQYCSIY